LIDKGLNRFLAWRDLVLFSISLDLGSSGATHGGSTPPSRTAYYRKGFKVF